ncbi:hypothetical protein KA093_01775 [Candidatus Saccharibacteria bacterium]|nr:hypothetical protein [Candidatus Saccharibacteria bacterium]
MNDGELPSDSGVLSPELQERHQDGLIVELLRMMDTKDGRPVSVVNEPGATELDCLIDPGTGEKTGGVATAEAFYSAEHDKTFRVIIGLYDSAYGSKSSQFTEGDLPDGMLNKAYDSLAADGDTFHDMSTEARESGNRGWNGVVKVMILDGKQPSRLGYHHAGYIEEMEIPYIPGTQSDGRPDGDKIRGWVSAQFALGEDAPQPGSLHVALDSGAVGLAPHDDRFDGEEMVDAGAVETIRYWMGLASGGNTLVRLEPLEGTEDDTSDSDLGGVAMNASSL